MIWDTVKYDIGNKEFDDWWLVSIDDTTMDTLRCIAHDVVDHGLKLVIADDRDDPDFIFIKIKPMGWRFENE